MIYIHGCNYVGGKAYLKTKTRENRLPAGDLNSQSGEEIFIWYILEFDFVLVLYKETTFILVL